MKRPCLAQLVNVIAPIMTEPGGKAWVQSIYYPFLYASHFGRGVSLRPEVRVESYTCAIRERVPYLDCSAVENEDGSLALFLVNRSENERIELDLTLSSFGSFRFAEQITLSDGLPVTRQISPAEDTILLPLSWNMLRFRAG